MELDPVDANRCQAEKKEGSFMTLGPRSYIRCRAKPSWIAIEIQNGKFAGAMSLCDDCKRVCEIQIDVGFVRLLDAGLPR